MERLRELVENGYAGGTMYGAWLTSSRRLARFIASPEAVEALAQAIFFRGDPVDEVRWAHMPDHRREPALEGANAILALLAQKALDDGS
jgi:hypothetical protein